MSETKVTASELLNGNVRMRQGGDANDWSVPGTTAYVLDRTNVSIQDGVITAAAGTFTVVYPVAFSYPPHLIITLSSTDAGADIRKLTETATGFTAIVEKPATVTVVGISVNFGTTAATGNLAWTAKGQAAAS